MRLALLAVLLLPSSLMAAELRLTGEAREHHFISVASDKAGQWLVLGPNAAVVLESSTLGGVPVLGKPRINKADSFTTDGGKGVTFVGPPGFYAVTQWGIADEPEPSVLVVEVLRSDIPTPVPPQPPVPPPVPPMPVPPVPTPAGSRALLILRETAETTPQLARLVTGLRSGPSAEYLKSKSHTLDILDDDSVGSDGKPSKIVEGWRPHFKDLTLPALLIYDPKTKVVVFKQSLPVTETAESVVATLRAHGG